MLWAIAAWTMGVVGAPAAAALGAPQSVVAVRSLRARLNYRVLDARPDTRVELWYTRDRGASWQRWGVHADRGEPLVFDAPAEGLYGFLLVACEGNQETCPPETHQQPQRWVFIDSTPPLAQWDSIEPNDAFATRRLVHLRWTAHDDHLPGRCVSLSYHSSLDQQWHVIEAAIPNTGRYDWKVPAEAAGQITLKLAVRDLGGHVVERLRGPIPIEDWLAAPTIVSAPPSVATRPAGEPSDKNPHIGPSTRPFDGLTLEQHRRAERLYEQGSWHLVRGEHAVAAERFREALEIDPNMLAALNDLAGVFYLQKDYDKAVEGYREVLQRDPRHEAALRGAALAYVAQRRYSQSRDMLKQLLAANQSDAEAWLDLGDVLFMMDDHDGALAHWRHAADARRYADKDAPTAEIIRKARRRLDLYGHGSTTEVAAGRGKSTR